VYGEFPTIPEGIARQLAYSDKTLSDNLLWCVTKGAEGVRPNIESALFTDYGPVMRYDVGGPHEAYLYLQQLNGSGYRWTPATNGTVYYSSKGQRWSWNGNEDNGDLLDANRLSVYSSSNGRQLGAHATDGVLYNFDFAQYYKALANSGNTPVLSRNVMMLRDDYIALYDDVSDESQNGTFKWSAREGGAYTEYYSNSDYTGLTNTGIRLQRFPLSDSAGAYGLPVRYVGTDTYSIKSTCKLFIPYYTGTYNFYVNSAGTLTGFNGTVQLLVNGTKVIDTTNVSQPFTPINLTGGQFVDVQLNYSHTTGSPNLALNWECVDSANPSIKLMNRTDIDLSSVYHQFDRQPSIYTVKGGAPGVAANGDQLHIVAPQALNVTNMDFGAVINASTDPQYVFSSDAEKNVADGMAVFTGKAGYAHKNELAIFEGTKAGINDFKIERSGGDFGFSAKYMDNNSITGRIAGKSGGTIYITPPYPFALNAVEVKVNGAFVGCTVNNGTIAFDVGISQADGYKTYTITTNGVTSAAGPVPTPTPTPLPAPMPLSSNLLVNNLDVGFNSGISPFSASSNTGASQQVVSIGGNNAVEFTDASEGTNSTSTFTATLNSSSTVVNRINQIYNMPVGSSPVEFLYSFKVERTKAASYPVPLNISAAIEFGNYDNINVPRFPVAESSIYNTSAYQHDEPAGSEVLEKVDYNDIAAFRFKITPNGGARNITSMMLKFNNRVNTGSTDEAYAIDDLSLLEILDTQAPSWNGGQLIASNPLQTSITLNWSGASDDVAVVDYQIFKDGQLLATTTNSSYVVTGLTQDTSYTFKIEARDAVGKVSTTGPTVTCSTSADKTVLNATISNAITALSGAVIGGQPGNYPESAVDALISAKLSALKVSNDPGSSQSTIDSQNTTLQNAINTFNSAIISGGATPTPISLNVPNSGFETGTDSSADYWSLTNWIGSPAYSRVSDILHGGGYSAKIYNAAYANGGWSKSTSSGRISVTAGKTHTVSIWTKTDNVSFNTGDGSYLSVQFYDSAGTAIGSATTSSTITGTVDWTKLSVTMSAPSNAASLRIDCRLKGTGTAWFDDVEVVQND
jgi:chitodextrinase